MFREKISWRRRDFLKAGLAAGFSPILNFSENKPLEAFEKKEKNRLKKTEIDMLQRGISQFSTAGAPLMEFRVPPIDPVRIGMVGVGGMGSAHVRNFLKMEGVIITAVCDIIEEKVARIQKWVEEAGFPRPKGYSKGPYDFLRLCDQPDVDLVFTATPWEWHVPVCVAAMKAGKHAATEVPAAYTIEDCWKLVETAEKYKRHCIMMENCCYDRPEMMCLNMVKKGLLGEIFYAEAGYLHDLRDVLFSGEGEALWRTDHHASRNGNLYPTHGLGPVSQCLDINRGDRFVYLVSMSSKSMGLNLYAAEKFGPKSPEARRRYALGDINVSLIYTAKGKVITLIHDTSSPRPYSRIHRVQGTKGIFERWPERVYLEGRSPSHRWESLDNYKEYDHPIWQQLEERARGAGHGGMDFIEDYRLVQALRQGQPLDMDVYDAVTWSVVTPLSEKSVANKSKPIDFPDFTRGAWPLSRQLHVMETSSLSSKLIGAD
ncbi:MAG: Gfo/Idh/MocA family oxidoreductase [Candidatus Aminicenantes bacterium]|nr:Gfo/Idh/MocA family oxidoreductase [Candidatus Aminicenantes bacterium]